MFTRIVAHNPSLCTFVDHLRLPLSRPQLRHILNSADSLLVTDGRKTLAALWRHLVHSPDVSNMADTFRSAAWTADDLIQPLTALVIKTALHCLKACGQAGVLLVNFDDSLSIKDPDTHHLQGVDWHYDHAAAHRKRARLQNALCYLLVNLVIGRFCLTFRVRIYLREQTVRRLNRQRDAQAKRLHFLSKYHLARQVLEELQQLIPQGTRVYVQCDAWYASAKLIKFVRRLGWHIICRVKANRKFMGKRIDQGDLAQRHKRYDRVTITAADGQSTTYLARALTGRLSDVPFDVCALVSKRHSGDKHPVYFISTDVTLTPQQVLQSYAKRWFCEVDHFYLKQRLGFGDFRLQPYEAIEKYCAVVLLGWAYVQWRLVQTQDAHLRIPGDVIRLHRYEHAEQTLVAACQEAIMTGNIEAIKQRFLCRYT